VGPNARCMGGTLLGGGKAPGALAACRMAWGGMTTRNWGAGRGLVHGTHAWAAQGTWRVGHCEKRKRESGPGPTRN
jgi:hypothetical protein